MNIKKYLIIKNYTAKLKRSFGRRYQKSYSQLGEDLIVKYIFDKMGIKNPSYLDIGAHDPLRGGNTTLLYSLGSRGINIEPDPNLFSKIIRHRKRDINLNIGIAGKEGEMDFYMMSSPTLNTFSGEAVMDAQQGGASILAIKKIRTTTISAVISRYWNGQFPDFLSIDTEGLDMEILRSMDFSKTWPVVVCAETISHSLTGRDKKNTELVHYMESNGYLLFADTYINSIFVKKDLWQKEALLKTHERTMHVDKKITS